MRHYARRHSRLTTLRECIVGFLLCGYIFEMKYKPGKQNVLADEISRQHNYELAHVKDLSSFDKDIIIDAFYEILNV